MFLRNNRNCAAPAGQEFCATENEGASTMTNIGVLWAGLDPIVQQWLLRNPGTEVLPRTHVNRTAKATGQSLSVDEHGEHRFSLEEMDFMRARRRDAHGTADPRSDDPGRTAMNAGRVSEPHEEARGR
jgi:hypothetical protein